MNTDRKDRVIMAGVGLPDVKSFKYLGSKVDNKADCGVDVSSRIASGWKKGKSLTGLPSDKKMPKRLKGKVYRAVSYTHLTLPTICSV